MNSKRWLNALTLLVVVASVWAGHRAQAQSPCPHADIRLDTDQSVDVDAICDAARPWADDGIRIFVFLTDHRPQSEDDWFALLDQAEADAGLRDLSQPDSFDKNALAFEASTATDLSWAYSITYGEVLYDSALDKDDATVLRVKNQMRTAIAAGDPTGAFVQALETTYEINHPAPSAQAAEPMPPSRTEDTSSFPWGRVLLIVLAVGVLGAGGYGLTVKLISPALQRARQRSELKRHLEVLETRTANLLNACDQLLQGDTPEETVLYQLFSAYGGEHYDDMRADVYEWLRRSQGALDDAFDLRQKLIDPSVREKRTLEETVQDWEMLYVTFVGNSERVLALADDELRTLLDPLLVLEREAPDVPLTEQLDALRRELAGGMPLKVELRMVDPAQTDAEGILGYIDQVKAQIARLQEAREQAPERLAEAKAQRQAAEEEVPSPFVMTEKQLFEGIDERLAQADVTLEQGLFLRVVEQAAEMVRDLETVKALIVALGNHERRRAGIDAITGQGYRPEHLADDLGEVEADLQTITQRIGAGDYVGAAPWIEELDTDSQRALAGARAWQALHEQNAAGLRRLGAELDRVEGYRVNETAPAWGTLQTYPRGNWADVADGLEQAEQTLQSMLGERVNQITQLNSMEQQRFTEAEQMLAQAFADLAQTEGQLQSVVNRLAEVGAAEAHIQEALQLTEADVTRATAFRDQEDVKIGPEVDQQLEGARERLTEGQRLAEAREFIAATNAQTAARELATTAYAAASEQVQEINALQAELEALSGSTSAQVERCHASAQALPVVAQTARTNELVRQVVAAFSQARQARTASTGLQDHALSEALRAAIAAYKEVDQLADQAMQWINVDRTDYDRALTEARNAIHAAQAAIQKAEWAVRDPDAQGAGRHALQRARKALAQIGSTEDATKEALARMRQQVGQVQGDAQQAERQARQKIRATEAERRRRQQRSSWSSASGSFGRASSSSSSRPSSASGSSRRSTARGSSRRSSSRGSSRRSSSRGSSRRR